jgi:hypothetical protein
VDFEEGLRRTIRAFDTSMHAPGRA